jgi:hypothetical protein
VLFENFKVNLFTDQFTPDKAHLAFIVYQERAMVEALLDFDSQALQACQCPGRVRYAAIRKARLAWRICLQPVGR